MIPTVADSLGYYILTWLAACIGIFIIGLLLLAFTIVAIYALAYSVYLTSKLVNKLKNITDKGEE